MPPADELMHAMKRAKPESMSGDLPPARPERPSMDECCNSGCNPCIFDLYEEALERYYVELHAWEEKRKRQ